MLLIALIWGIWSLLRQPRSEAHILKKMDDSAGGHAILISAAEFEQEDQHSAMEQQVLDHAKQYTIDPQQIYPSEPLGLRWGILASALVFILLFLFPPAQETPAVLAMDGFPLRGNAPLDVFFHNHSIGRGLRYRWDFGDGSTPVRANSPIHTFHGATAGAEK